MRSVPLLEAHEV